MVSRHLSSQKKGPEVSDTCGLQPHPFFSFFDSCSTYSYLESITAIDYALNYGLFRAIPVNISYELTGIKILLVVVVSRRVTARA